MRVIEAGCGKGDFSPFLLEKIGEQGTLLLNDISDKMLEYAKIKLRLFHNVWYMNCDFSYIILLEKSVNRIFCFNSFPHFSDKIIIIKKLMTC